MTILRGYKTSRCIYNTDGVPVAFVQDGYLFGTDGKWLGFIQNTNHVYSKDGQFIGYLIDDDRVVRKIPEMPRMPMLPPLPPLPPFPPLAPSRFPLPPLPFGYEDVFATRQASAFTQGSKRDFSRYEGMSIVANDGTFLGKISKNVYDRMSISNAYTYGSKYPQNSLFNSYGKYGGKYSQQSPFNPYAKTPPTIQDNAPPVAILTVNKYLQNRLDVVDPTELFLWLGKFIPA